jgi:hypothetical protein
MNTIPLAKALRTRTFGELSQDEQTFVLAGKGLVLEVCAVLRQALEKGRDVLTPIAFSNTQEWASIETAHLERSFDLLHGIWSNLGLDPRVSEWHLISMDEAQLVSLLVNSDPWQVALDRWYDVQEDRDGVPGEIRRVELTFEAHKPVFYKVANTRRLVAGLGLNPFVPVKALKGMTIRGLPELSQLFDEIVALENDAVTSFQKGSEDEGEEPADDVTQILLTMGGLAREIRTLQRRGAALLLSKEGNDSVEQRKGAVLVQVRKIAEEMLVRALECLDLQPTLPSHQLAYLTEEKIVGWNYKSVIGGNAAAFHRTMERVAKNVHVELHASPLNTKRDHRALLLSVPRQLRMIWSILISTHADLGAGI